MAFSESTRQEILAGVERLIREKVAPLAQSIDQSDEFPHDLFREAAAIGLFALGVPEEYGGIGRDLVTPLLISERIARVSAAFALTFNNTSDAMIPIVQKAKPALKQRILPKIASGETIPCISISEPQGGSDVASIRTHAQKKGDRYVISGRKAWCTNGSVGGVYTVFAKTDLKAGSRGISAFIVEKGTKGFTTGRTEPLMGLRGSPVTELVFEDAEVPEENLVGAEGDGFLIAMLTLNESRLQCGATALGVATAAFHHALEYARQRQQFGQPIIEHQGLKFLFAELATELAAARALWSLALSKIMADEQSREASTYAGMTKLHSSRVCMRLASEAIQIFGANGLSRQFPVERLLRDAKAFEIYDGTSQIQMGMIGKQIARSDSFFDFLDKDIKAFPGEP